MTWENSKAITPLKRDFLKAFFSREKRFFPTGGSALGLFYLQHRYSYDLDLFLVEHLGIFVGIDNVLRSNVSRISPDQRQNLLKKISVCSSRACAPITSRHAVELGLQVRPAALESRLPGPAETSRGRSSRGGRVRSGRPASQPNSLRSWRRPCHLHERWLLTETHSPVMYVE